MPLLLAAKRARDLAVSVLPAPCGVLGTPNVGAAAGDANGLPGMPPDPGAKLKPPLGVGVAGAAVSDETVERTALDSNKTSTPKSEHSCTFEKEVPHFERREKGGEDLTYANHTSQLLMKEDSHRRVEGDKVRKEGSIMENPFDSYTICIS